jgi:hypothetical protein
MRTSSLPPGEWGYGFETDAVQMLETTGEVVVVVSGRLVVVVSRVVVVVGASVVVVTGLVVVVIGAELEVVVAGRAVVVVALTVVVVVPGLVVTVVVGAGEVLDVVGSSTGAAAWWSEPRVWTLTFWSLGSIAPPADMTASEPARTPPATFRFRM